MNQTAGVKLKKVALYCIHHPDTVTPTGWNVKGRMFHGDCPECLKESEQDKCKCKEQSHV